MSHPSDLIGQQIDHYHIRTHLASGGMADVYLAQDMWLNRLTALKVLKETFASESEHRTRFQREAQAIARLQHPHIVEIFNIGELPDKRPYFTMPYLPGGSLADWLIQANGRPMSALHATTICRHIADALNAAHQAGIVHRDLKPANILLREPLDPVVTDFGIAAISEKSVQLTQPGVFMGTFLYASPEQKLGQSVDHRSDIYSLGVILFELLVGMLPVMGERPLTQLEQTPTHLSPFLCRLVAHCLNNHPNERYQSAADLVYDLNLAITGVTETRPSPTPTRVSPQQPRWTWFLLPLLLVLIALGGYLLYLDLAPPPTVAPIPTLSAFVVIPSPVNVDNKGMAVTIRVATSTLAPPATFDLPSTATPTNTPTPTETAVPTNTPTPSATSPPPPNPARVEPAGRIVFTCFIDSIDQLCTVNADATGYTQITNTEATDFYGSFDPITHRIVFISRRDGAFFIYDMNPDGSDVRLIGPTNIGGLYAPVVSPDGQRMAFTAAGETGQHIWVMNMDGSGLTKLTDTSSFNVDATWSPDGSKIAFSSLQGGASAHYIMNADGSDARKIDADVAQIGGRSDWSPDGNWIAFYAGPQRSSQIYLTSVSGNVVYQLTNRGSNLAPSFSPDGNWIVFTSYRNGEGDGEIYIMRLDGTDVRRLTTNDYTDWQPRWER